MTFREHVSIFGRIARMLFCCSRVYIGCIVLRSFVEAILPYVPVYFSAKLIDGLIEGRSSEVLLTYAGITVGSVFLLKMIQTYAMAVERQKCEELERSERWMLSLKTMGMAYASIEDSSVYAQRERIKKERQTGYCSWMFLSTLEMLVFSTVSIIASLAMAGSFLAIDEIPEVMRFAIIGLLLLTVVLQVWGSSKSELALMNFYESCVDANVYSDKFENYVKDYHSGKDIRIYGMEKRLLRDFMEVDGKLNSAYHQSSKKQVICTFPAVLLRELLKIFVRAGLFGGEPQRALLGFAHLAPVMGQQQLEGAGKGAGLLLAADEVCTAKHVAPLVVAAHLQTAAKALIQLQKVIALHEHVGELQEGQAVLGLHARLVAVGGEHLVDREGGANVAHEVDKVEVTQPVAIVDDNRLVLAKVEETTHLLLDLRNIIVDGLDGHHLTHVGLAGRIADHRGAAAHQGDRLVACALHMRHGHDRDVVTDMQGICSRVEADIEGSRVLELLVQVLLVGYLRDKAAILEDVENVLCHVGFLLFEGKLKRPPMMIGRRETTRYHFRLRRPYGSLLMTRRHGPRAVSGAPAAAY